MTGRDGATVSTDAAELVEMVEAFVGRRLGGGNGGGTAPAAGGEGDICNVGRRSGGGRGGGVSAVSSDGGEADRTRATTGRLEGGGAGDEPLGIGIGTAWIDSAVGLFPGMGGGAAPESMGTGSDTREPGSDMMGSATGGLLSGRAGGVGLVAAGCGAGRWPKGEAERDGGCESGAGEADNV